MDFKDLKEGSLYGIHSPEEYGIGRLFWLAYGEKTGKEYRLTKNDVVMYLGPRYNEEFIKKFKYRESTRFLYKKEVILFNRHELSVVLGEEIK